MNWTSFLLGMGLGVLLTLVALVVAALLIGPDDLDDATFTDLPGGQESSE